MPPNTPGEATSCPNKNPAYATVKLVLEGAVPSVVRLELNGGTSIHCRRVVVYTPRLFIIFVSF